MVAHSSQSNPDILLQARALRSNLAPSSQRWSRLVSLYQQAVELDPSSVLALTGLASALIDATDNKSEDPTAPAKYRRADELITQAELLQPDHVEVMCARVYLLGKQRRYTENSFRSHGAELKSIQPGLTSIFGSVRV